jgi:hypothetical protein
MHMRTLTIALLFCSFVEYCFAQDKRAIFKMLPLDCTPELSKSERDSLLHYGIYILPGGDSIETVRYVLDTTGDAGYFNYGYSYTTGQNGFLFFEILNLSRSDGGRLILFSRVGGVPRMFHQQEVRSFNLLNGELAENKKKLLPSSINLRHFVSAATPDSILSHIDNFVSYSYDFHIEAPNTIKFTVLFDDVITPYIVRDTVYFKWKGRKFIRKNEK